MKKQLVVLIVIIIVLIVYWFKVPENYYAISTFVGRPTNREIRVSVDGATFICDGKAPNRLEDSKGNRIATSGMSTVPATCVVALDLDSDGYNDLVVADTKRRVIIYMNNRDGTFTPRLLATMNNVVTGIAASFIGNGKGPNEPLSRPILYSGGSVPAGARSNHLLLRNNGDFKFIRMASIVSRGPVTDTYKWRDVALENHVEFILSVSCQNCNCNRLLYSKAPGVILSEDEDGIYKKIHKRISDATMTHTINRLKLPTETYIVQTANDGALTIMSPMMTEVTALYVIDDIKKKVTKRGSEEIKFSPKELGHVDRAGVFVNDNDLGDMDLPAIITVIPR